MKCFLAAEDFPRVRKDFHEELERKKKALNQVFQLGPPSNRFPETEIQRGNNDHTYCSVFE